MKQAWAIIFLSLLSLAGLARAEDDKAPRIPDSEADRALARFEQSCAVCHPTPDPRFAMDRAWIRDVQDTA